MRKPSRRARSHHSVGSKIYIGGLSYSVTDRQLRDMFTGFGTVSGARVITDKFTGQSRGFGFVEMSSDADAQAAIEALNRNEMGQLVVAKNELGVAIKEFDGVDKVSEDERKRLEHSIQSQEQKPLWQQRVKGEKTAFRVALPSDTTVSMEVKVLEPVRKASKELAAARGMTAQQLMEHLLVEALNNSPKELEHGKKRLQEFKGSTQKARRFAEREELARLRQLHSTPSR